FATRHVVLERPRARKCWCSLSLCDVSPIALRVSASCPWRVRMQGNRSRNGRAVSHRRRGETWRRVRRGFSILELTVVLIMMGIIAAMAVRRLNYDRYRADAAMRVVRTVLQGAQRNAIMRQTDIVVAFDLNANLLRILEDTNNNCRQDNGERLTTRPLEDG